MTSKVDRAKHGPGWGEVILGAVLSLILGVVIGALLLIVKPVIVVPELPKEPVPGAVYFVQGASGGSSQSREVLVKRNAFVAGQSVKVTEGELNALASSLSPSAAPAAKPGEKPNEAPKSDETIAAGVPNVRIRKGSLQIEVPITLNVFGFEQKLIAQARGGFEKEGDVFAYEPDEIYLGSCPVQRLPFLAGYIRGKMIGSQKIPDDLVAAWKKLANVTLEDHTLNLSMQ